MVEANKSLPFILLFFMLICCREEEPVPALSNINLSGYVQKGPFINGTAITVSELDEKLVTTGKNFSTQIMDNKGSFSIKDISLESEYVQLRADGFYYDEVKGEKSIAQLTLYALANVEDISSVNVNLLSHLEKERVIYLIQEEEKSFGEAKKQAQQEILTIFNIEKEDIAPAELLDISKEGEDNAILLAISAILQADNTVAELSELLANIITDIREDGKLDSESNQEKIRQQAVNLHLSKIRTHLIKRYEELGMSATIANFEKYVDTDGDGILNKDEDDTPDEFTFTAQKDAAVNTEITSNAVTISGIKEGGIATAFVDGYGASIIHNATLVTGPSVKVKNGDQLQIQVMSSGDYAGTVQPSLTIGTLVTYFQVITDDYKPDAFVFSDMKDVAIETYCFSDTIIISGLPHLSPVSLPEGILYINGEDFPNVNDSFKDVGLVKNGDTLYIGLLSSSQYAATTSTTLDINGVKATFSITTDDYKPDDFSFTPIENAKRDSVYTSETITISGLLYPTLVNLDNGKLIVNNTVLRGSSAFVSNGDQISIELSSSQEYSSETFTNIQIGSVTKTFKITTEPYYWQRKADYPGRANNFKTGFSIGNKIYVGTGYSIDGYEKEFYEYDPEANKWTKKADFGGEGRDFAIGFTIGGKGYIGMGAGSTNHLADFWEYDPVTDTWKQITSFPGEGRRGAAVFVIDNVAYIGLGETKNYDQLNDFWKFDPSNNQWTQIADFKGMGRAYSFNFVVSSKAYIGAGSNNDVERLHDFWEYNPSTNEWTQKQNFDYSYERYSAFTIDRYGYTKPVNSYSPFFKFESNKEEWTSLTAPSTTFDLGISTETNGYIIGYQGEFWEFTPPQE